MDHSTQPTIFICYGFCEGPKLGQRFTKALEGAGFQISQYSQQADIFIGHSGGCLCVPAASQTQLAVLIGIPYYPGKSLLRVLYQKNRADYIASRHSKTTKLWWRKLFWNSLYLWNVGQNRRMQKAVSQGLQTPQTLQTLCIRNRDDMCCREDIWKVPTLSKAAFVSISGVHDDLWVHPEPYAAIIKAYYGANVLAQTKAQ